MDTEGIAGVLEAQDVPKLIALCEEREFEAAAQEKPHPSPTLHLLALLLQSDLTEARFLWRRLPAECKDNPDTIAVWALAKALWQSDMPAFYDAAKHPSWGGADTLVSALVYATRRKGVQLIARAYTCVSLERVSTLLGLDRDGAAQLCHREGWTVDGEFVVVERRKDVTDNVKITGDSRELRMLTEQLVRLQTSG